MYDRMLATVKKDLLEQCNKETGVTPEDMRGAVERNVYGEKQMCFEKCLAMKTGTLENDGRINIDYMKVLLKIVKSIYKRGVKNTQPSPQQTAVSYAAC